MISRLFSNHETSPRQRTAWLLVTLMVLALLIVQYARLFASQVSLTEAIQDKSGGGDTIWSLWTCIHGYGTYLDAWEIPFSCSYYNWLFYSSYAFVTDFIMKSMSLADEWIQTVTAYISLGTSALAGVFFYLGSAQFISRGVLRRGDSVVTAALLCAAVAVAFGPMLELMPTSLKSDPGALMFELLAFWLIVRRENRGALSLVSLVPVVLACYGAWGFRQTQVGVPVAFVLYLLVARRWKEIAFFCVTLWALFGATFFGMRNTFYWQNCYFVPTLESWSAKGVIKPFMHLAMKTPQCVAGLLLLGWMLVGGRRPGGVHLLLRLLCLASLAVGVLTSGKPGAHCHYLWTFSAYTMLLLLDAAFSAENEASPVPVWKSWSRPVLMGVFVMLGLISIYAMRSRHCERVDHRAVIAMRASLAGMPRPVYVHDSWLFNLPWITESDPPLVPAWLHDVLGPKTNRQPAHGGVTGLTELGWYGTIAVPAACAADDPTLVPLSKTYDKVKTDEFHTYWTRKSGVVPPAIQVPTFRSTHDPLATK